MGSKATTDSEKMERNAPVWVKALVTLHLFAITVWCLPNPPKEILDGKRPPKGSDWILVANHDHLKDIPPLRAYLLATGAWQYWDMFAPNPVRTDFYASAEVEFQDGTVELFRYPRVHDYPIATKYVKERYRKFFERVRMDENAELWPYFGQRIALLSAKDPSNPPLKVRLRRHWLDIAPPGGEQQQEYKSYTFFEHRVDLGKLRKDLGWR